MNKQENQPNKNSQGQQYGSYQRREGEPWEQLRVKGGQIYGDKKKDFTLGGKQTMKYIDNISQNCTLETYIILLTNVTQINSINKK